MTTLANNNYDSDQIQVLEGLEAVRKRPGMYIGDTGTNGLHHLVYEILDNSIDEVLAGHCDYIVVEVGTDKHGEFVVVQDNGRGIPFSHHESKNMSAARVVMEILHAGGKFGGENSGYGVSGGLHGVGISVVNALSSRMEVYVVRGKTKYSVIYENGGRCIDEQIKPTPKGNKDGTYVKFWPDSGIFTEASFDRDRLLARIKQTAFLTPQVALSFQDLRDNTDSEPIILKYSGGLRDYVEYLTGSLKPVAKNSLIYISSNANPGENSEVLVELAMIYITADNERIKSFANNISTTDGGTHVSGFRSALTRALNEHGKATPGLFRNKDKPLAGQDISDGLIAVISVKLKEPQFEGQTKNKLGSQHVEGAVRSVVYDGLRKWFTDNPTQTKAIIERCLVNQRARDAARRAAELSKTKSTGISSPLVGKLAACSGKNPANLELFIVEGESAGGSAKEARDKTFQAILPLKGKPLNVEKQEKKMASNDEIKAILAAIGTGIGKGFNIDSLRYHKIIIMTDADFDGDHIRTLLLTLFCRHFEPLVTSGHLWIARPPLYKLIKKNKTEYIFTEDELKTKTANMKGGSCTVQRFKGLGEMNPEQLWETTMDPAKRMLQRITIDDFDYLDSTITTLMSDAGLAARKEFIVKYNKQTD